MLVREQIRECDCLEPGDVADRTLGVRTVASTVGHLAARIRQTLCSPFLLRRLVLSYLETTRQCHRYALLASDPTPPLVLWRAHDETAGRNATPAPVAFWFDFRVRAAGRVERKRGRAWCNPVSGV